MAAVYYTAGELADRIAENKDDWIPSDFMVGSGLVYSSPATLAYNSPGAEGYGVKRAALAVPESIELIISPGCCGRNTSDISMMKGYENRFYYLTMDEADIVTGRHLKRIPDAVKRILSDRVSQGLSRPKVVMLVTTCVDALLGTDMEHVCRVCEEKCGVKVRPAYMYALTRDGVKPPMVQVRESIFSLLEKRKRKSGEVNIIGYFDGMDNGSKTELAMIIMRAGAISYRSISDCATYEEFMKMSDADFNVVLDPEARVAAEYMHENFGTGSVEMKRFYGMDRISEQYKAYLSAFNTENDVNEGWHDWCLEIINKYKETIDKYDEQPVFAVGECLNAHSPELALSLMELGFKVNEVFCTLSEEDAYYIAEIASRDPGVKFYFNQHPTMVNYESDPDVNFSLGKDASWYYKDREVAYLSWNSDIQPFGYHAIKELMSNILWAFGHYMHGDDDHDIDEQIDRYIADTDWDIAADDKPEKIDTQTARLMGMMGLGSGITISSQEKTFIPLTKKKVHGYRRVLTPFAPDQSGAVAALRMLGNIMIVVLDAGGCTGNICGFDLGDWWKYNPSMIFSAGLRDMDAVLGRDKELVAKVKTAVEQLHPESVVMVGTPVPSVIGTDYKGLARLVEKETGLPTASVPTNGMELYDEGIIKAYREISPLITHMPHGVYGFTHLDYSDHEQDEIIGKFTRKYGFEPPNGGRLTFSVSGYEAANGVIAPDEMIVSDSIQEKIRRESRRNGAALIVGEQIYSNAVRSIMRQINPEKKVIVADFFKMIPELTDDGDVHLKEEEDLVDLVTSLKPGVIFGDPVLKPLLPEYSGRWIERIHYALSGTDPFRGL